MPRGPTPSTTKRSSNNQNTNSNNHQNGSLAPLKRQQARSRASSNAINTFSGNQSTAPNASTGQSQPILDVPSNDKASTCQEPLQAKQSVASLGMSANNSSGD